MTSGRHRPMVLSLPVREVGFIVRLIGAAAQPDRPSLDNNESDLAASVLAHIVESLKARDQAMREDSLR